MDSPVIFHEIDIFRIYTTANNVYNMYTSENPRMGYKAMCIQYADRKPCDGTLFLPLLNF